MRDSSELWEPTVAGSHTVASTVGCYYAGDPILDAVPISEGTLTLDSTQLIPGDLSISVPRYFTPEDGVKRDLLPSFDSDAFACNGQQLALSYTIGRPGHGTETIDLGWYRTSDWTEDGAQLQVNAASLEAVLDEDRFLATVQLVAGTGFTDAVRTLVADLLPLQVGETVTGVLSGRSVEDNRLDALAHLVSDWGYRMWVDDSGVLNVDAGFDDDVDPAVAALADGEGGTVVAAPTAGSRDGVYNAVVASGESDGAVAPVSAVEYLLDGPRAWNGPYGNVPYFYSSPQLNSIGQCRAAARTRLTNLQALANPVNLTAIPDPRYQLGDVVALYYAGYVQLVRIDALTLPLTAAGGVMSVRGHEIWR